MEQKPRVLSGFQPSGSFHIGNYFSSMKKMVEWQEKSDLFCFLANLHALTSVFDGPTLAQKTLGAAMDFLALGLDPDKCVFWVQSDVKQHAELTWFLDNCTSMGLLERCHAYKEKVARGLTPNHGLFAYPVLMAADILMYQANLVPVGQDQKQHVEVARDVAGSFNNVYGPTFTLPEPLIDTDIATIPGLDGQKMSKSYGNTIEIFMDRPELKKRVMSIVTDTRGVDEVKDPDHCTLFALYRLFATPGETEAMRQRYLAPGLKYVDTKKALIELIWNYFEPHRAKRAELAARPDTVRDILKAGAKKAEAEAEKTMALVRQKVGVLY